MTTGELELATMSAEALHTSEGRWIFHGTLRSREKFSY
jgi:hypothetical protein